jgi:hypothetical protein
MRSFQMDKPKEGFKVLVREGDTKEVLLKEIFPDASEAENRRRELLETSAPEGIPTEVVVEPKPKEPGQE